MVKLILHVGMQKTEGHLLQKTLFRQRYILEQHGLNYLRYTADYSRPLLTLFSDHAHKLRGNIERGYNTQEKLKEPKKKISRAIEQLLSKQDHPTVIMSGDGLTNLPMMNVGRLASFLKPFFDAVEIVAYVRPPSDYVINSIEEAIRAGACLEDQLKTPPLPNYRAKLEPYQKAFGSNNVSLRIFDKNSLHWGCIVADFLKHAHANKEVADSLYKSLSVQNTETPLSKPAVFYMDTINRSLPVYRGGNPNPTRGINPLVGARTIEGEAFTLPGYYLNSIFSKVSDDIHWIKAQMSDQANWQAIEDRAAKKNEKLLETEDQIETTHIIHDFLAQERMSVQDNLALYIHKTLRT